MKYIELFGIPACGKSYITNKLIYDKKLKDKAIHFSYFYQRTTISFIIKFFYILLTIPFLVFKKEVFQLIRFFSKLNRKYSSKLDNISAQRMLSLLFNSIYLISLKVFHQKYNRKSFIFVDQGYFQILLSILYDLPKLESIEIKFIIEEWIEILISLNSSFNIFLCENEYDLILERLLKRGGDSFIERNSHRNIIELKLNKTIDLYQKIKQNIIDLEGKYSSLGITSIDMNKIILKDILDVLGC